MPAMLLVATNIINETNDSINRVSIHLSNTVLVFSLSFQYIDIISGVTVNVYIRNRM